MSLSLGGPSGLLRNGVPCLSVTPAGYYCVMIDRKSYQVHRLVWELAYGPIPEGLRIDHRNGDRKDNRLENLRLCTHAENCRNKMRTRFSYKHGRKWRPEINQSGQKYRGPSFEEQEIAEEFGELLSRTIKEEFHRDATS